MWLKKLVVTGLAVVMMGCNVMKPEPFESAAPTLSLSEYFEGETWAWGIFEDRFGQLRRQFRVKIDGRFEAGVLELDEHFVYRDGETARRVWTLVDEGGGRFIGRASDIGGIAVGQLDGNTFSWSYEMDLPIGDRQWRVRFDDWMWLQPGGVMINRARVTKWGFELGTVTLFFTKQRPAS